MEYYHFQSLAMNENLFSLEWSNVGHSLEELDLLTQEFDHIEDSIITRWWPQFSEFFLLD